MKITSIISFVILITLLTNYNIVAQWQQVKGIYGGSVNKIQELNGNIFAATEGSGVWVTTDNGQTWAPTSLNEGLVRVLISDKGNLLSSARGFSLSTNNGLSWLSKNISYSIQSLMVVNNVLYGGVMNNGVVISTNYGDTWQPTSLNNRTVYSLFNSGSKLFAGTQNGVYSSADNGVTWIAEGLTGISIGCFTKNGNTILAGAVNGIYYSTDNGAAWIQSAMQNESVRGFGTKGENIFAATTGAGIFASSDNGLTWQQTAQSSGNFTSFSIINNLIFVSSYYGGVYSSANNGANWNKTSFINYDVTAFGSINDNLFANIKGYNFNMGLQRSSDGGSTWSYSNINAERFCSHSNILFVRGNPKLHRSTDLGLTWQQVGNSNADGWQSVVSNGGEIFASKYVMQRSTDNGNSWGTVSGISSSNLVTLAANGPLIFVSVSFTSLRRSTNAGGTWSELQSLNGRINSITINNNVVYCATSGAGVYVSTNQGEQWSQTSIPEDTVYSVISNNNYVVAGTSTGVYISLNEGTSWQQVNSGLPNTAVKEVFVHNGYLYTGVSGRGIWKRLLFEIIGINQISSNIPNDFSLSQNYPNPFNPVTNIEFSLPKNELVKLVIYDAAGREIETLVNSQLNAGTYKAEWNASGYPSGVYFYSINAGSFSKTNKMILVK